MKYIYRPIYLLVILLFSFSCKEIDRGLKTNKNQNVIHENDTVWFDTPKSITEQDSVKITLHYSLNLDTLNVVSIADRYTMFYYTYQNISEKKMAAIVRSRDEEKIKELGLKGTMIKNSFDLHHKFNKSGTYYITGFIEDNLFLKKPKEDKGQTRKIGTYINQKIIVDNK